MKKILFSAVTLDTGGIEKALITLLNYLAKQNKKYEITLVLEKKQGIFLDELDKSIKIIKYTPNNNKIIPIRKLINFCKRLSFEMKYKNKFDFSCSYATYSLPASFVARTASQNSYLWCHMDYLSQYGGDKDKVKEFFEEKHFRDFKKLIFVSEKSRETFLEVYPEMKEKVLHINNIINSEEITKKAKEVIDESLLSENKNEMIFVNVSRHDENQKRISRIIEASKILKEKNYNFKVILVGDGENSKDYENLVKQYNLENTILFLGRKKNPYPYIKMADCVLLTSDYEGSPVTFTEAMVLNKPIITTDVSGAEQIKNKFGLITDKTIEDIASKMAEFIENKYEIKEKFDSKQYNEEAIKKIESLILE